MRYRYKISGDEITITRLDDDPPPPPNPEPQPPWDGKLVAAYHGHSYPAAELDELRQEFGPAGAFPRTNATWDTGHGTLVRSLNDYTPSIEADGSLRWWHMPVNKQNHSQIRLTCEQMDWWWLTRGRWGVMWRQKYEEIGDRWTNMWQLWGHTTRGSRNVVALFNYGEPYGSRTGTFLHVSDASGATAYQSAAQLLPLGEWQWHAVECAIGDGFDEAAYWAWSGSEWVSIGRYRGPIGTGRVSGDNGGVAVLCIGPYSNEAAVGSVDDISLYQLR